MGCGVVGVGVGVGPFVRFFSSVSWLEVTAILRHSNGGVGVCEGGDSRFRITLLFHSHQNVAEH